MGACGNLSCPRGTKACRALLSDYLFYLAFENSLCADYITEKLWRVLGKAVPVVLGGANYTKYLPPHSLIDIRDFRSARELAVYLTELAYNQTLYLEYFKWMRWYKVFHKNAVFCSICEYVNDHTFSQEELDNPRADIQDLVNMNHTCLDPDDFYKGIL